jgi:ABC-type multidrug transport system fused ATPase/permease subunit
MKYIKFYRYLLPFRKKEILILLLNIAGVGLSLTNPYLIKLIIDKAYGNKDLRLFIILIGLSGGIFVLSEAVKGVNDYLSRYIRLRIAFDLNRKVFKKLQSLPYRFFQDSSTGENLYRINYDIEQVSRFVADLLPEAVSLIPRSLLILAIIFFLNWKMALLALALTPFLYFVPYYFTKRLRKIWKMRVENSQYIFERLQEVLSHIHLVKAFGREKSESRNYIRSLIRNIEFSLTKTRWEVAGSFANSLFNRVILGLIVFYGGYQVIKGRMTFGSLSAIAIYLTQLSGLQSSLAQFFQQISLESVSCERLEAILSAQADCLEDKNTVELKSLKGDIEFKNVTFGYKEDESVLKNMTFSIPACSCVGLVGPSGCGKTTIVNLILRLYRSWEGEISIDGLNINSFKPQSLYKQIGIALQEPYLWNDTVENNIRYGKDNASSREISYAAKIACADEFVSNLSQRYDTVIGESACRISEGQKQRLAIARAVIKHPKILILDEALSSVDTITEEKIINNIRGYLADSTIIVISHRPSMIKKMDSVYFLVAPGSINIDTHENLLSKNAQYQDYLVH